MSNFNVFTIPQLKKICVHTGISNLIKFSVAKSELIQQISKYLDFDGYNFTIKETNQQQFLQSNLLKKEPKLKKLKTKVQDVKDIQNEIEETKNELKDAKSDLQEIKALVQQSQKYYNEYQNLISNIIPEEIYPKKPKKNINLKIAKANLNKLVEPKKIKIKKINLIQEVVEENPEEIPEKSKSKKLSKAERRKKVFDLTKNFESANDLINLLGALKENESPLNKKVYESMKKDLIELYDLDYKTKFFFHPSMIP